MTSLLDISKTVHPQFLTGSLLLSGVSLFTNLLLIMLYKHENHSLLDLIVMNV